MKSYPLVPALKPVLAAMILGACSTTPETPRNAWKITPLQTVSHGAPTADGYFALARVKEGQGAAGQAVEAYRKAIAADPAHAAAWNALGALQMQLGRADDGLQALEQAVSLAPTASRLHNNLGYALLLVGRDDDAAKALRRAVELDGGNRRAWSNLATAYRRLGALDRAEFAEARASGRRPVGPGVTIGSVSADQSPAGVPIATLASATSTAPDEASFGGSTAVSIAPHSADPGFATASSPSVRPAAAPWVTMTPRATLVKVAENVYELRSAPTRTGTAASDEAAAIIAGAAPPGIAVAGSPAATTPAHPEPPAARNAANRSARYEISNGQGGEGLAQRLAALLGQQGIARPRLTNHRPYKQAESVVQYRDGYRATAEAFASQLPFRPVVMPTASGDLKVDVRLLLGHDLRTSDACTVLGLCPRLARSKPAELAAVPATR